MIVYGKFSNDLSVFVINTMNKEQMQDIRAV